MGAQAATATSREVASTKRSLAFWAARAARRAPPHRLGSNSQPSSGVGAQQCLTGAGFGGGAGEGQMGALSILAKGHTTFTSQLGWSLKMSGPLPPHHLRLNVLVLGAAVDEVLGEKRTGPRAMVE